MISRERSAICVLILAIMCVILYFLGREDELALAQGQRIHRVTLDALKAKAILMIIFVFGAFLIAILSMAAEGTSRRHPVFPFAAICYVGLTAGFLMRSPGFGAGQILALACAAGVAGTYSYIFLTKPTKTVLAFLKWIWVLTYVLWIVMGFLYLPYRDAVGIGNTVLFVVMYVWFLVKG